MKRGKLGLSVGRREAGRNKLVYITITYFNKIVLKWIEVSLIFMFFLLTILLKESDFGIV